MPHFFSLTLSTVCTAALLAGAPVFMPSLAQAEEKAEAPAAPVKDYVILEVGGDKIHYREVENIWKSLFPEGQAPDFSRFDDKVRQNVLRGIVSEQAIYQKAKASGLENSPKIKEMMERLKRKLITQEYIEQQVEAKVSDADVRKEYEKRAKEKKGTTEVHARHILVKTKEEAEKIKEQLDDGENFEKLAREKSGDTASGKRGGDLGYFGEDEMVPEFTKAAFAMEKGEVSDPVKSEFGWHIIKLDDKREAVMPPFEEVDATIREELKAEALKGFIQDVVDTVPVKYYSPEGKELELTKTPDALNKTEE